MRKLELGELVYVAGGCGKSSKKSHHSKHGCKGHKHSHHKSSSGGCGTTPTPTPTPVPTP